MIHLYKIFILLLIPGILTAQSYLDEDFSGSFPPAGWQISAHADNWSANSSNNAGGSAPEARLNWSPQFSGSTYLISQPVDLTGVTNLKVQFKHMLDHYSGSYSIGAATRSGGGSWNTVWEVVNPGGNIPATEEIINISNSDVGSSDFQIAWFFSGSSYNIDYWYIDDIMLFTPLDHDVTTNDIIIDYQYEPGSTVAPEVVVKNFGLNEETFDVTCEINIDGNTEYSQTSSLITLPVNGETTLTFPGYTASAANELFEVFATTNLSGDLNTSNDSRTEWFNTYTLARELVILEIGTGTWCPYCPGAAMGADDLIANGHPVGVVEYHNSGGDPFQNTYSEQRVAYYGITGYPTAVFDGVESYVGGSNTESMYDNYLPICESRAPVNVPFDLNIFGESSGNDYSLTIMVDKVASIPPWDDLVLQVALTESEIPYSWQGQNILNYVERLMFPDASGTPLDFSSNNHFEINIDFTIDPSWVAEHCEIVAFVQNNADKEIHQGSKVNLTELQPVPVELVSFNASSSRDGVTLVWSTATEINNNGFEIQRSTNGKEFNSVGFVQGAGTTTEKQNYSYFDEVNNYSSQELFYRLRQVDYDGKSSFSKVLSVEINNIPSEFTLSQNYPNPFNPTTKINYAVPEESPITIKLYDMTGQEVLTLVNEVKEPGYYTVDLNAADIASGIYIYRMIASDYVSVKKMSILK